MEEQRTILGLTEAEVLERKKRGQRDETKKVKKSNGFFARSAHSCF